MGRNKTIILISLWILVFFIVSVSRSVRSTAHTSNSKMLKANAVEIPQKNAVKYTIELDGRLITFREAIKGWKESPEFREFYINLLINSPFTAAFWETPPVNQASLDRPYEFVMVNSARLANVRADAHAFKKHFDMVDVEEDVVAFDNLTGTARLIAPVPQKSIAGYGHLVSFMRTASSKQRHQLLQKVGLEFETAIGEQPVWLSTSGLGVYWLHVRLDDRPKYYTFMPYKSVPRRNPRSN